MTKDEDEKPQPQEKQDEGSEKKPLSVDLSEDAEPDDKPETQQQGKSRAPDPRRKSDWRQFKEQHEQTIADLRRQSEQSTAELRRQMESLQRYQPQQQPQARQGEDLETQIQELWDQQQVVLSGVGPDATAEQRSRASNLWRKLDRQRRALEGKADTPAARADSDSGGIPAENQRLNEYVQDEFPEISGDQSLALEAEAELLRILRQPGRVKSRATVREACERVKTRHNIGRKVPGPTDLERSRYGSTPARAGANGGGNGQHFSPNKMQLSLARAFTSHLPDLEDEERVRIWARNARKDGVI